MHDIVPPARRASRLSCHRPWGRYEERSIQIVFCNPNSDVLTTMRHGKILDEELEKEWLFVRIADAVRYCVIKMREEDMLVKALAMSRTQPPHNPGFQIVICSGSPWILCALSYPIHQILYTTTVWP